MPYTLHKDHTTVNFNYGNNGRDYIVIHYTGNETDTAKANANYFRSANRDASAHYFVDDTTVYEVVAPENTAWSVGVNFGYNNLFGKCNNWNSISIEMCSNNGRVTETTVNNTISLTKELMKKYNIPASRVVRHFDVCSKSCPGWLGWIGSNDYLWKNFKSRLSDIKVVTKKKLSMYSNAYNDPVGKSSKVVAVIPKGTTVKWLYDDNTGWSYIEYNGKKGYCVNSRLKKSGLSKYPKKTVAKGTEYKRVVGSTIKYTKKLKGNTKFTLLNYIEKGKYQGYYYCTRIGRYYYIKF